MKSLEKENCDLQNNLTTVNKNLEVQNLMIKDANEQLAELKTQLQEVHTDHAMYKEKATKVLQVNPLLLIVSQIKINNLISFL